jgi:YVTN family beta-propeller protein
VANSQSDTVTLIRTATGTIETPIRVGNFPFGIAITLNGKTAYVANYSSGTVTPHPHRYQHCRCPIPQGFTLWPSRSHRSPRSVAFPRSDTPAPARRRAPHTAARNWILQGGSQGHKADHAAGSPH